MVEIHLYGKLRRYGPAARPDRECVLRLEPEPGETVSSLLVRAGIAPAEIYHLFLNGSLLATHNTMAPWLKYQQVRENVWDWELAVPVKPGDRLGLFSSDMALLVV